MCRLFGFRSAVPAPVHRSLVDEKNSLQFQSRDHPDGWGIASYDRTALPAVAHGLGPAHSDPEFERVSDLVASRTVLAHVRQASVGPVARLNTHPFLYGRWAFGHNGNVRDFAAHQREIESWIDPDLLRLVRGDTDSERCFYLFLTHLRRRSPEGVPTTAAAVAGALGQVMAEIARLTDRPDTEAPTALNLMATNGQVMVATRLHRTLFYSEQKRKEDHLPDPPPPGSRLAQLVISSEQLTGEEHWHEVPQRAVIGVEADLTFRVWEDFEVLAGS